MDSVKNLPGDLPYSPVVLENSTSSHSWIDYYSNLLHVKRDVRVDGWFLMDSVWPTVTLCSLYLLMVKYGPRIMQHRKELELKGPMLAYNLFQVFFNAWVLLGGATYLFSSNYNWICQSVDYSDSPQALATLHIPWWFFFSKFIDFSDSLFFILRKKNNQLTNLHIIHHSTMPFFTWFGAKFTGGGNTVFVACLNLFVHVVMYSYYFLAAIGVRKEYLWWKKYLTGLQMLQFLTILIHSSIPFYMPSCRYPKEMSYLMMSNMVLYLFLFGNFYVQAYIRPKESNRAVKKQDILSKVE